MSARTGRARLVAVLAAASVLALGACTSANEIEEQARADDAGSGSSGLAVNTSPDQDRVRSTPSDEAIALLPPGLVADGKLTVAVGAFTPPLSFLADDNETVIGNEPDIAQLVADGLGLDLELITTDWSNWPLATQSGSVDVTIANVTVTEERKELFDFSSYRVDNLGFLANANSGLSVEKAEDIAGLTIAVGSGTNQEKILLAWDAENQAAGLEPIDVQYFENDGDSILALQSGRLDLYFGPNPTGAYKAGVAPQDFEVVGTVNGGWPQTAQIAVATAKGNGLAEAITAALNHAIDDGTYAQVLERWGLTSEAIERAETNPPGLPRQPA
ncbi:ABC transporter substrate-binding protein [Geodermatophilus ruber]|uniref:Amino acid ABC transporter substrate-binding protein, PAAT family n=1 Tax=Geodermatophilus ruber TaxID=504800 RepID=A0A1I4L6G8_9ACTN|nr:ABC transporter substrate-binding protein [Geodermatophilus ruber]SFL86594.1 amino acid ABC transporter substrate-binding protein, PAAT family [Geodermatophilus ruber]